MSKNALCGRVCDTCVSKKGAANGHPKVDSMANITIFHKYIGCRRHFVFIQSASSLVCPFLFVRHLVMLERFKNFETLIRKRKILGEPFDLR